jgi:predicted glycosyltransferase
MVDLGMATDLDSSGYIIYITVRTSERVTALIRYSHIDSRLVFSHQVSTFASSSAALLGEE